MTLDIVRLSEPRPADDWLYVSENRREHRYKTTIQHWQLRDLVSCRGNDNVYFVQDATVRRLNLATGHASVAQVTNFIPTSMTVGHGYLASGGQSSQLKVTRLRDSLTIFDSPVGGLVNNALSISHHSDETRLLVSNNDNAIKCYELPSMRIMDSIRCETSVNYTAVSPDGNWMVATGDTAEVFLYSIHKDCYRLYSTLEIASDSGMSCAWNASSTRFATASQDGSTVVWDLRSLKPLVQLSSFQRSQVKGACRSVKFCPTPSLDLLAFSEHLNYVHVADCRDFSKVQTIRLGADHRDVDVSGIAFNATSSRLIVGTLSHLTEFAVDTVKRRTFADSSLC